MRIAPNRSQLEARVLSLRREPDGLGASLDLLVLACRADRPGSDFIGASPGDALSAYTAVPEALAPGRCYRFEASVLGGPQGERVVVSDARPLEGSAGVALTP